MLGDRKCHKCPHRTVTIREETNPLSTIEYGCNCPDRQNCEECEFKIAYEGDYQ